MWNINNLYFSAALVLVLYSISFYGIIILLTIIVSFILGYVFCFQPKAYSFFLFLFQKFHSLDTVWPYFWTKNYLKLNEIMNCLNKINQFVLWNKKLTVDNMSIIKSQMDLEILNLIKNLQKIQILTFSWMKYLNWFLNITYILGIG